MAERNTCHDGGRPLRPPTGLTPLDRDWRRRQWRLEQAHDDFALHAATGDPRAPIHAAAGIARFHRRTVRESLQAYRRTAAVTGAQSDAAVAARCRVVEAFRSYRSAIADLADAVAAFTTRNTRIAS